MVNSFFKVFDKKRFMLVSEIIFVFGAMVLIINIIGRTYTRYESRVDVFAQANIAFFVVDQGTYENSISLNELIPSNTSKYYKFYVTNYDRNKRADTDLDYNIKFVTTTNLPLTFEIIRNEDFNMTYTSIIDSVNLTQDDYGVYYRTYYDNDTYSFSHNSNQLDVYEVKVTFPVSNQQFPDKYQGKIDLFSIVIDAKQKMG